MSFVLARLQGALKHSFINKAVPVRCFTRGSVFRSEETEDDPDPSGNKEEVIDPAKDRRKSVPVETSIRYLASDAFKQSYGGDPVWKLYRRNHKGQIPPEKTRKTCIRQGVIATGNPCPICRDKYLVLDYRNVSLLKQFISEFNGEVLSYSKTGTYYYVPRLMMTQILGCFTNFFLLSYSKTGVCQRQHKILKAAILRAKNYGTITYDVPMRKYDYSEWYRPEEKTL